MGLPFSVFTWSVAVLTDSRVVLSSAGNGLGDEAAAALAKMLAVNQTLTAMDVSGMWLWDCSHAGDSGLFFTYS